MAADEPAAKKRKKAHKPLEPLTSAADDSSANCKFARALGSTDWHTREQGLQALTVWLSRNQVAEQDLVKIWKALFFCFWHSDQAHIQSELAERLAGILPQLSPEGALLYFRVFARTIQREWFGIDRLRLDKFMMLARKFMRALFVLLREADWDSERSAQFCGFLAEEVFARSDAEPSAGFALHFADVAVGELCGACEEGPPVPADALQAVLEPFCAALAATKRPALAARLQDGVFGELLERGRQGALEEMDMRALAARLFELGALPETRARNREVLYSLSKTFERAAAKRQKTEGGADASSAPAAAAALPATPTVESAAAAIQKAAGSGKKQGKRKAPVPAAAADKLVSARLAKATHGAASQAGASERPGSDTQAAARTQLSKGAATALKAAGSSGKGRKRKAAEAVAAAEAQAAAGAASSGRQSRFEQQAPPAAFPSMSTPRSSMKARPKSAPVMNGTSGKSNSGKKRKSLVSLAAEAAARRAAAQSAAAGSSQQGHAVQGTPAAGTPVTRASGSSAAKKVKFALKKNLYFTKGGPVPPVDLRTPPTAQPKGSALKKATSLAAAAQLLTPKSPKSMPRARAAMFF